MFSFFRIYLAVLFISFLIPILDFPLYIYDIDIVAYGKIPFLLLFLISFFYHLKNRIFIPTLSLVIAFSLLLAFILSLVFANKISGAFLSHIYALVMPIFSISFGYHFYAFYIESESIRILFRRVMFNAFFLAILMTILYIYFYFVSNKWSYYGFATAMPLVFGYIFIKNRNLAHIGFLLNIFTGKRSTIIVTLIYYLKEVKIRQIIQKPIWSISLVVILIFLFIKLNEMQLFKRFELILDFDMEDSFAIFIATGGRLTEVVSVFQHLSEYPIKFIFGSGLGAKYMFVDPRQMFPDTLMHYTHFSPTFYLFLIGLPFTIFIYYTIFKLLKSINKDEPITYVFLSFFVNSFFGSIMFVDPRFWFFLGCVYGYKKINTRQNGK